MSALSSAQRAALDEELRLLARLRAAVERAAAEPGQTPELPDLRCPYFGHLRLTRDGRPLDLLLGFGTFVQREAGVRLVHWREAPLARVFFDYEEGEPYEVEEQGRTLEGEVLLRRVLTFGDGELSAVEGPEGRLERGAEGDFVPAPSALPRLSPIDARRLADRYEVDAQGRKVPVVGGLLDEQQQAVLRSDVRRPLLVLGGAGHGKTTVALHRLAWLHRRWPRRFSQQNLLVVVPEEGLARLTRAILGQLGLEGVSVLSFDAWVTAQARRVFADLPRRICPDTPAAAVTLKRHPALAALLPRFVEAETARLAHRLDRALAGRGRIEARFIDTEGPTPLARLERLYKLLLAESSPTRGRELREVFGLERARLFGVAPDLLRLFGERTLLEQAAAASSGGITARAVETVLQHTRAQLRETSEARFAHVSAEAKRTADGRSLDEGTPDEAAGTVDIEDFAVCFELLRLKTGATRTRRAGMSRFAHLVLDEAQELAPIELSVLRRALQRGGTLTVCGDQAQQIDPGSWFEGWPATLGHLRAEQALTFELQTNYRCTAQVTEFAYGALGMTPDLAHGPGTRQGAPVLRTLCPTAAHAAFVLARGLDDLLCREPAASVAVVAADEGSARELHRTLGRTLEARLVLHGEFSFTPGLDITTVAQVRGLEFDVVVLPDVSPARYPDTPRARRTLYLAATRAVEQLWVLAVGRFSPLVPPKPRRQQATMLP